MAAFLFDLDGTMINSDAIHEAIFADLWAEHGLVLEPGWYQRQVHGRLNADIFAELLPDVPDHEGLSEAKEAEFRARLPVPYPSIEGLKPFLDRHASAPKAVVTNAPRPNAEAMLTAIGVRPYFDVLVIGQECAKGKPDPDPYLEAMRQLNVAAKDCVAFEDSPSGVKSARASGATTVGIRSSLGDTQLRAAGAHLSIIDYNDTALDDVLTRF